MKAEIIDYKTENIPLIAERLKRGEVGIFPCDTIYGICACVCEESAERIYEIKHRPQSKSFIELMTKSDIDRRGLMVDEELLSRWPAPFTAIVKNSEGSTTAVRVPSDEFLQDLLKLTGPIYSTSSSKKLSTKPSPGLVSSLPKDRNGASHLAAPHGFGFFIIIYLFTTRYINFTLIRWPCQE